MSQNSRYPKQIEYSHRYQDGKYEYRHVLLPRTVCDSLPRPMRLLTEAEWRALGVQQSRGWQHYMIHEPEIHVLLFRRDLGTDPNTGVVDPDLEKEAREAYQKELHEWGPP